MQSSQVTEEAEGEEILDLVEMTGMTVVGNEEATVEVEVEATDLLHQDLVLLTTQSSKC